MNRDGTRMRKDRDQGLERAGQVEAGTSSLSWTRRMRGDNGRGRDKGSYGMEEDQKSNTATISK